MSEGILTDLGKSIADLTASYSYARKIFAAVKRGITNTRYVFGNDDAAEAVAILERIPVDGRYSAADAYALKAVAVLKCRSADASHTVGDDYLL